MTEFPDSWTSRLSEYVDGELDAPTRAALEAHLGRCAECRAARDALARVVARARRVPYREPTSDLWRGIEASIVAGGARRGPRRVVTVSLARLAVAAAVVAVLAGGVAWEIATKRATSAPVVVRRYDRVDAPAAPVPAAAATPVAAASYREAAADLERALEAGRSRLRPGTMRVIEENLRAIDVAIAQADSALRRDPGSAYLNQYLAATMQRKLRLLREAVEITSRS